MRFIVLTCAEKPRRSS